MSNSAPEKIYLPNNPVLSISNLNKRTSEDDIEYTRTDAFIEKACEYFRGGLEDVRVMDDYRDIAVRGIQASYTSVEEFIENFKNYMKGEEV